MPLRDLDVQKTVGLLNSILEHELAGVVRYTHYALMVTGPNRIPIVAFMTGQAQESLLHAQQVGELLTGLEGHPSMRIASLEESYQHSTKALLQESLNNVFKYARATQVNVNLFLSAATVHFETCDNGIGFDLSSSKPTSLGMRIMRERAEAIGADFHISSTVGAGTCVEVTWNKNPNLKLRVL